MKFFASDNPSFTVPFLRFIVCILFGAISFIKPAYAAHEPQIDEITVFLNVPGLGETEMPALIADEQLYLSVTDLFDFIKINYQSASGLDSISGFFIEPQTPYVIDYPGHQILFKGNKTELTSEAMLRSDNKLYLRITYLGSIFGLECLFKIRSLSVTLNSAQELPAVRMMRLEKARSGSSKQPVALLVADTTIGKNKRFFHIGAADWSINSYQEMNGLTYSRFNLGLGGVLAGGELKTFITQTTGQPFRESQQYYLWRHVDNNNKYVRQMMVGKIAPQAISSIFDPVVGVQCTNAPSYNKKSFSTFTLSGYYQPNWVVELYVNNVLIDYVKSDALGFINYNIPLPYGATEITTRYVGPWGEEHRYSRNFNIPFTFVPAHKWEYTLSAGVVEDHSGSIFAQGRINYGLTDKITVGGGTEYLSSVSRVSALPFLNTSVLVTPDLLFTGEYVQGTRYKGMLNYHVSKLIQATLNYSKYDQQQESVKYNYTEERRASISAPFRTRNFSGLSRLAINQNILDSRKYNNAELYLALVSHNMNLNVSTFAHANSNSKYDIYGMASSAIRLPGGIIFTPRVSYDYVSGEFISVNLGAQKYLFQHLCINAAYEYSFTQHLAYVRFGFKYDLSFARVSASVNVNKNTTAFFESASGSLVYGDHPTTLEFTRNSNVGRGGIAFWPFLDLNGNGKREENEPKVNGLNIQLIGGGLKKVRKDSIIVVSGLEAYTNYMVKLDGNNFENIAWKLDKKVLRILVDPNQIKSVDIPVSVLGEVSGTVFLAKDLQLNPLDRMRINIYDDHSRLINHTLSESDGYFSYLGLKPGNYTASVDPAQLIQLGMNADMPTIRFTILPSNDGDVADKLVFILNEVTDK